MSKALITLVVLTVLSLSYISQEKAFASDQVNPPSESRSVGKRTKLSGRHSKLVLARKVISSQRK